MRFSIITPSYRSSSWLKLCIASVADQNVSCEHIIQDAGSDDGTLEWLRDDPRVRLFVEPDSGMYDAINRGLRRASGDILAYLNCDEQYLPGALAAVASYFENHPDVDVVFGNAVAVNGDGHYLWHRKMLRPLPWHTWTCGLSVLTCATFFRRTVIDSGQMFFNPDFRYVGDSEWVLRLIQRRVRMGLLGQFTSVFTHTGANLSLDEKARHEAIRFHGTAPRWIRLLRPGILVHHRVRRWLGGIYHQPPFTFDLYTRADPTVRIRQRADRPTFRWRW